MSQSPRRRPGPAPYDPALVRSVHVKSLLTPDEAESLMTAAAARAQSTSALIRTFILAGLAGTQ